MTKSILKSQGITLPVVTTLHGTDITLVGKEPTFSPVVQFTINQSDGVTAVSEHLRETTLSAFDINRSIEVIYNFIDFDRFKRSDKSHFKKALAPEGERILVHVSNFRKVKRSGDVIQVFKRISDVMPAKLLMVGDGPERSHNESMCRELGLCDDIRFLGKQDAVEELLAVSDLFILPSANESFGLAALEAMACEVPVISSNVGGLPEVNVHDYTGYLADVGDVDAMANYAIDILKNEDKLAKMRANALEHAKTFSIEQILPQYEAHYTRVIEVAKTPHLV
jgi:N-acetyl-alpha-D-glucosaminyl L-malate synthase BshA